MQTEQSADYVYSLTREIADWWPRLVEMIDARTPAPAATRTFGPHALSDTHDCGTPWAHTADSTPDKPRVYCPACTAGGTLPGYLRAPSTAAGSGGSPAPLRISALYAVHTIRSGLISLEIAVRDALGDSDWVAPAIYQDPNASILQTTRYLGRQAPRIVTHDTLTWTIDELRRLTGLLRAHVGTGRQVRAIAGPCPICNTWSLRAILGREQIICTNPDCRCQQQGCGCHDGHPHTWRFHPDPTLDEWARLSLILDVELYGHLATDTA